MRKSRELVLHLKLNWLSTEVYVADIHSRTMQQLNIAEGRAIGWLDRTNRVSQLQILEIAAEGLDLGGLVL